MECSPVAKAFFNFPSHRVGCSVVALFFAGAGGLLHPSHGLAQGNQTSGKKLSVVVKEVKLETTTEFMLLPARLELPPPIFIVSDSDGVIEKCLVQLGAKVALGQNVCFVKKTDPGYTAAPVEMKAHVSGQVSEIFVGAGSTVSKQDKLVTLLRPELARLIADIPSARAGEVAIGTKADLETLGGKTIGQIELLAKAPAPDQTTATVKSEFAPIGWKLGDFQIARAKIPLQKKSIIQVPESAISYESNKPFVRLISSNGDASEPTIVTAIVELGASDGEMVEIRSGLKQGDQLVVKSSGYVKAGDVVSIQETGARASK